MNRSDVTDLIIEAKVKRGISWAQVAERVGKSKEWTTAACLGQMTFDAAGARAVMEIFDLPAEAEPWLRTVPYKGSCRRKYPLTR